MKEDRQFVEALARGIAILEALSKAQRPLTNRAISQATGLAPSTISRLTHTLTALGYTQIRPNTQAYELTPKNLTLGYPVLAGLSLLDRVRPFLHQLADSTGETVALAVRSGVHIIFVEVVQGRNMLAVRLSTGGRLPIALSAGGLALLAAYPDKDGRMLAARVRADITRHGGDHESFNRNLKQTCRDGLAVVRDAWRKGIGGVAVPINVNGEAGAVSMPVATSSVSESDMRGPLAAALRDVADKL